MEGARCINWLTSVGKEAKKRRSVKQRLGEKYPETLILGKNYNGEICDIIFVTNRLSLWKAQCMSYFRDICYQIYDNKVEGGIQYTFILYEQSPFITVSFFEKNNKIMVQHGDWQEKNILAFILDFQIIQCHLDDFTADGFNDNHLTAVAPNALLHTTDTQTQAEHNVHGDDVTDLIFSSMIRLATLIPNCHLILVLN